MSAAVRALALALGLLVASCGQRVPPLPLLGADDVVLAFGDSLTYGTGASAETSYPTQLAALIGRPVVGAGVPGETSGAALARLPAALDEHAPRLLILCLGGNDMLRKIGAEEIRANLGRMIELARARGVAVMLLAVPEPKLFGGAAPLYAELGERYGVPVEGAALVRILRDGALKSDPIHPNAAGYRALAQAVAELLRAAGAV